MVHTAPAALCKSSKIKPQQKTTDGSRSGFELLPTGVGRVTPCYSLLSIPYVPATTITDLDRHLVTDTLFALSYPLAPRRKIPVGPIVGGGVGGLFLVTLGVLILCWRRRHRSKSTSSPPTECRQQEAEAKAPQPPPKSDASRGPGHREYYPPHNTYHIDWSPGPLTRPPGYHDSGDFAAELPALGSRKHPSANHARVESEAATSPADENFHPENMISPLSLNKIG